MKKLTKKERMTRKKNYDLIRKKYKQLDKEGKIPLVSIIGSKEKKKMTYIQFKRRIKLRMESSDVNLKTALRKEANTETYTSAAERSRVNLIESLKEDFKGDYDKLRNLSREKGRFKALKENLEWSKEYNAYLVGGRYLIDVTNSPEQVIITDIETGTTV